MGWRGAICEKDGPTGAEPVRADSGGPVVLFDGDCGLCSASVQFILRHERSPRLQFAPLRGTTAAAVLRTHPTIAGQDSMVLVERGRVLTRSAAALRLTGYLRWPWPALRILWAIPRPIRDWAYGVVARHRHHLPGGGAFTTPAAAGNRFLP